MTQGTLAPYSRWRDVDPPAGWGWTLPFTIQRNGRRFRAAGFDVAQYANTTGKAYYVSTTGSDAGTGADWDHALRSIDTALAKADAEIVYIKAGSYTRSYAWDGYILNKNLTVIGVGGMVVCTNAQDGLVWALTAGQALTYQTTRSGAGKVLDVTVTDSNGDFQELALKTSIAEVEAAAGSYWISGTTVYVHTYNNRVPDANIWVTLTSRNAQIQGDVHVYLENIDFVGGYAGVEDDNSGAGQTPELYLKNCKVRHSMGNGLEVTGQSLVVVQGCLAARNNADGFNYHALNTVIPKVIEINVTSRDNGFSADDDNGSSIHDGGSIVRIMGVYTGNKGPNVADGAPAASWNLGGKAFTGQASIAGAKIDWNILTSGVMWLDRVRSYGSDYGIVAGTGATIHKRLCLTSVVDGGGGTIDTY